MLEFGQGHTRNPSILHVLPSCVTFNYTKSKSAQFSEYFATLCSDYFGEGIGARRIFVTILLLGRARTWSDA